VGEKAEIGFAPSIRKIWGAACTATIL